MKKLNLAIIVVLALISVTESKANSNGLLLGVRQHKAHSEFTDLPFADDDLSYLIGYETGSDGAYWQIILNYSTDITGDTTVETVMTPQVNLMLEDDAWRFGIGGLMTYQEGDDYIGDDWTDIYWQMIIGLKIPIFGMTTLEVDAIHVYESWSEFEEFDVEEMEFAAYLAFKF